MKKFLSICIWLCASFSLLAQIPTDGLVAYYPFNGNVNDESGNGHDGTLHGGATLTTDRFGNENSAYNFDGYSGYIETANSTNFDFPQYSISVWINFTLPHDGIFVSKDGDGGFRYGVSGHGIFAANCCTYFFGGMGDYNDGDWHHFVWVQASDSFYLYMDNIQEYKFSCSCYSPNTEQVIIGGTSYFGKTDDIRFYDRALSPDEILILYNEIQINPEICIVSVTPDEHNKVVWDKPSSVESYNIYRETTQTDIYEVIGSVNYEDSSIFVDLVSNPQQMPYKYKLTAITNSGTETGLSNFHRTIHLTIFQVETGCNLIWSPYEGFPFNTYYIYRGTNPNQLTLIDSISGSFTSYTDTASTWIPLYYTIEVINKEGCSPNRSDNYNRSRSNVQYNKVFGIDDNPLTGIKIYPNPTHENINIEIRGMSGEFEANVYIYDINGQKLISKHFSTAKTSIDIKDLKPGVYILQIEQGNTVITRRMVVI